MVTPDAPTQPAHPFTPDFPGEPGYRCRCRVCGEPRHPSPIPTPRKAVEIGDFAAALHGGHR